MTVHTQRVQVTSRSESCQRVQVPGLIFRVNGEGHERREEGHRRGVSVLSGTVVALVHDGYCSVCNPDEIIMVL